MTRCDHARAIPAASSELGASDIPPTVPPCPRAIHELPGPSGPDPISPETLQRNRARLAPDGAAWRHLEARGLDPAALKDRLGVGLTAPAERDGKAEGARLAAPIIGPDGVLRKRLVKIALPVLSEGPPGERIRCAGAPLACWDGPVGDRPWLVVVGDVEELWALAQVVRGTSLAARIAIVASTHPEGVPEAWEHRTFWEGWERVLLAHGNDEAGERMAMRLRRLARREVLRAEPPRGPGRGWADLLAAERGAFDARHLEWLLDAARPMGAALPEAAPPLPLAEQADGVYEDRRVNVNGAFTGGRMYYPFQVRTVRTAERRRRLPEGGWIVEPEKETCYETRVVRSDGVVLGVHVAPAPPGVAPEDRAVVLDDGTEALSIPRPRAYATWAWPSIERFVRDAREGRPAHRPLSAIIADLVGYLRGLTWLPDEHDHALLAAYVVLSYVYDAVDAIPMLLLNGEKGSGKSSLAEGLADLSYNGHMLGGGSERAFVRFVDEGRGLLVLDDLETVGRRGPDDGGYGDINQILKVGYSRATGLKTVVERGGATRTLNFYGPKVITNISGIDAVNATRTFAVHCRPMPPEVEAEGRIRGRDLSVSEPLRQELHAWGMANVAEVHRRYREATASRGTRARQIAAPLEVIGAMAGDGAFAEALGAALARRARAPEGDAPPGELLARAVRMAVARGAREELSMAQVRLELALIPEARLLDPEAMVPEGLRVLRDPAAVGRMLLALGVRTDDAPTRARLHGEIVRSYRLRPEFVADALEQARTEEAPVAPPCPARDPGRAGLAFCEATACEACPYHAVCEQALPGVRAGKRRRVPRMELDHPVRPEQAHSRPLAA